MPLSKDVEHYRQEADHFRQLAESSDDAGVKKQYSVIAAEFDALAEAAAKLNRNPLVATILKPFQPSQ